MIEALEYIKNKLKEKGYDHVDIGKEEFSDSEQYPAFNLALLPVEELKAAGENPNYIKFQSIIAIDAYIKEDELYSKKNAYLLQKEVLKLYTEVYKEAGQALAPFSIKKEINDSESPIHSEIFDIEGDSMLKNVFTVIKISFSL